MSRGVGVGNERAAWTDALLREVRGLDDFDLRMFLSEIADHGYGHAVRLLSTIQESQGAKA